MDGNMGKRFVSIKEAARILGLSERYLRSAVDNGEVPGFYTPKRFNVDMDEYARVLSGKSTASAGRVIT